MNSECNFSYIELKHKIESWCAYQDRSTHEVRLKLESYGASLKELDLLILSLIKDRFLDEKRFASSFSQGKFRIKKWGRLKIKFHLRQKRVEESIIIDAFKEFDLDEYWNTLLLLANRKFKECKQSESFLEKKVKTQRFLISKGYENDLIYEALKQLEE